MSCSDFFIFNIKLMFFFGMHISYQGWLLLCCVLFFHHLSQVTSCFLIFWGVFLVGHLQTTPHNYGVSSYYCPSIMFSGCRFSHPFFPPKKIMSIYSKLLTVRIWDVKCQIIQAAYMCTRLVQKVSTVLEKKPLKRFLLSEFIYLKEHLLNYFSM